MSEDPLTKAALARLPPTLRKVLIWRRIEALTLEEVGMRIGRTPQRVRQMEAQAARRLQEILRRLREGDT